jgi:hypothetical protein
MLHSSIRYSLLLGLFALTPACSSGDDDSGGTGGGSGMGATGGSSGSAGMSAGGTAGMPAATCETAIVTSPDKNYEFHSELTVNVTPVKPSTELTFDWSGVKTDFLKRNVDLNNVDMIEISLWEMSVDAFETGLNNDTLMNPIVIADIRPPKGTTTASIFGLNVPAGPLDQETILNYLDPANYPPENHMYAVMVANGFEYGQNTYMLGGFKLDPASTTTNVAVTSESTKVEFTAKIAGRPVTNIPAGTGAVTIDWGKMKTTASGGEFIPSSITRFRVGHYTQSVTELEGDNFLQLDEIAAEMYEAKVDVGTKISFDKAVDMKTGKTFAGIDDTGTWLVALNCGACQNPAPWYLSILKPCAP